MPVIHQIRSVTIEGVDLPALIQPEKQEGRISVCVVVALENVPAQYTKHQKIDLTIHMKIKALPNVKVEELGRWVLKEVRDYLSKALEPIEITLTPYNSEL